jgi:hypothetical protein
MLKEDNNGYVHFPISGNLFTRLDSGKTMVYLVAFDTLDLSNKAYDLSNNNLFMPGSFVGDDIVQRPKLINYQTSIDELIDDQVKNDEYDSIYFPNFKGNDVFRKVMSIPLTTSICLGWSEYTYELRDNIGSWTATFRDLTNEGRKLYYSIKKLHNNKEVRILTFNNIN